MALDFVAGCIGGAAGVAFGYPLDTVKVRIQTQEIGPDGSRMYRGTVDCLSKIIKTEGAQGLYKGMSSPLFGVAGINAITFGAYGNILKQLPNQDSLSSITIAGSGAGLIQSFIVSPMELVKTQMQVCGQEGIGEAVSTIVKNSGVKGLFKGLGITFTREVPAFGIYFGSYELMIREFGENTATILTAGGLAGILSWIFTYPQDVIKTRIQADGYGKSQIYKGYSHCLKLGLESEGSKFLLRGVCSTVIRAFPTNAVTFGVYSFVMKKWGYEKEEEDTLENLRKRIEYQVNDISHKIPNPWRENKLPPSKMSMLATDGPNILTIKEPLISSISYARMYPEQMLWACPESTTKNNGLFFSWSNWSKPSSSQEPFSNYEYSNFNQFSQRSLEDSYKNLPAVMEPTQPTNTHEEEPSMPSMLRMDGKEWSIEDHEKWKRCITTRDFLIPANLLSSKKMPDRILGFYYFVN